MVAFIVIVVLTFAVGFVCGHYVERKSSREIPDSPTGNQPAPVYEVNAVKYQEQDLELKENVAPHTVLQDPSSRVFHNNTINVTCVHNVMIAVDHCY